MTKVKIEFQREVFGIYDPLNHDAQRVYQKGDVEEFDQKEADLFLNAVDGGGKPLALLVEDGDDGAPKRRRAAA